MNFVRVFVLSLVVAANLSADPLPSRFFTEKPKLVLFISVDQFRADYLTRFHKRFLPAGKMGEDVGGFQYLMTNGSYFPFAQYGILQDMTGPGHAIMSSGALPYQAGVPLNNWANAERTDMVYCAEDASVATVGVEKAKAHAGTSPKNLLATTVSDELKNAGYPSRVVSIALKDRAAIFMGGKRADLALWFDQENFKWVSSKYYLPDGKLPAWVNSLNSGIASSKGQSAQWNLEKGTASGLSQINVAAGDEKPTSFGLNFPHPYKKGTSESLTTPLGLEMTTDAVEKAVNEFKLGNGLATDYLAVSFSSHDYVGHLFGPNSREAEEMAVADDKAVSRMLNLLQKKVPGGLRNVLVVLTADHGIPPNPDWLRNQRVPAGRVDEEKLQESVEQQLVEKVGKPSDDRWIGKMREFNIYLNPKAFKKDVTRAQVEQAIKEIVMREEWVATAFGSTDVQNKTLPGNLLGRQIERTYYPGRSGDVIIIPKPYFMPGKDTVTHMTGYTYDRTVPLFFAGPHVKSSVFATQADIIDIAPTLSFILGVIAPNMSEGRVLEEILR